jgi:NADP-dependent 3-hydroxy acid dehydrogenase YdfG
VVLINSGAGKAAKAGWSAYAAAKHGLKALADSLRDEVRSDGVRVTSVFPGRTATDMQAEVHAHEGKVYDPACFVRPEDVARVALLALRTPPPAVVDEISVRPQ